MKSNRSIPEGQRNSTLSRIAGRLVKRFGVTDEARQKFLDKAAECNPPLDDTELESIWNSACKFGSKVTSQDGYVPPDQFGQNPLLPDDFSDVGEARTFVDCFGEEITFTVATNYLRYNGVYWEESEQAAVIPIPSFRMRKTRWKNIYVHWKSSAFPECWQKRVVKSSVIV